MAIVNEGNRKPKVPAFVQPPRRDLREMQAEPVTPSSPPRRDLRDAQPPTGPITPGQMTRDQRERYPFWNRPETQPAAAGMWSNLRPLFQVPQPAEQQRRDLRDMQQPTGPINPGQMTRDQRDRYPYWNRPDVQQAEMQRTGRVGAHVPILTPAANAPSIFGGWGNAPRGNNQYSGFVNTLLNNPALATGGSNTGYNRFVNTLLNNPALATGGSSFIGGSGSGGSSGGGGGRRRKGGGGGGWGSGWGGSSYGNGYGGYEQTQYPPNMGLFSWNFKG